MASGVMPEHVAAGAIMVIVPLEIFDESACLIDEDDAR